MTNRSNGTNPSDSQRKSRKRRTRGKKRKSSATQIDVDEIIHKPITVLTADGKRKMCATESGLRKMAEEAVNKENMKLCRKLLTEFHRFNVIDVKPPLPTSGVLRAPKGVVFHDWLDSVTYIDPETGGRCIPDDVIRELIENE